MQNWKEWQWKKWEEMYKRVQEGLLGELEEWSVVMKFGGTSVGTAERIAEVAKKVAAAKDLGQNPVVVVSAMAGETDELLNLARKISRNPNKQELDLLLSTGETVSTALLAIALTDMGYAVQSFTGRQTGILTDAVHGNARIRRIYDGPILEAWGDKIPIVAGFQGFTEEGNITTLGRGGSDTTAVALAASLGAAVCEIYTDVDGVYTADPNLIPDAQRLDRISYDEMLEMASLGAKVLHPRAVELAKNYRVPVVIKSTFGEGEGTMMRYDESLEKRVVSGVVLDKNQARITVAGVPDRPGIAAMIIGQVSKAQIVVDMIVQNVSELGLADVSFTVARADAIQVYDVVQQVLPRIGGHDVKLDEHIVKVSIVGAGMRGRPGVASTMFAALADENINILMISTSEITISVVIDEQHGETAVRALHNAFELHLKRAEVQRITRNHKEKKGRRRMPYRCQYCNGRGEGVHTEGCPRIPTTFRNKCPYCPGGDHWHRRDCPESQRRIRAMENNRKAFEQFRRDTLPESID